MKQPQDTRTIDMLDSGKRGRGRPRVENPLSAAERAKRYRDKKRQEASSRTRIMSIIRDEEPATKKSDEVWRLEMEIQRLKAEVDSWRQFALQYADDVKNAQDQLDARSRHIDDLVGALDEVLRVADSGKRLPVDVRKGLHNLLLKKPN